MKGIRYLAVVLAALLVPVGANAAIVKTNTFLANPDVVVTFSELGLPSNTTVTNQYVPLGVEFSPGLLQSIIDMANFSSHGDADNLVNFGPQVGNTPVFIQFQSDVSAAAFAMVTNPGTSTFTTLLNGVVQETASLPTAFNETNDIYQFTGRFDTIRIDVGGDLNNMGIDNLQFKAVPEPGTLALLGVGLAGFAAARRRRQ